jgi:hypothetical protein
MEHLFANKTPQSEDNTGKECIMLRFVENLIDSFQMLSQQAPGDFASSTSWMQANNLEIVSIIQGKKKTPGHSLFRMAISLNNSP